MQHPSLLALMTYHPSPHRPCNPPAVAIPDVGTCSADPRRRRGGPRGRAADIRGGAVGAGGGGVQSAEGGGAGACEGVQGEWNGVVGMGMCAWSGCVCFHGVGSKRVPGEGVGWSGCA